MMNTTTAPAPRSYTHPLVFLLLVIPFGAASGFLGVTIVYLLGKAGVDPVLGRVRACKLGAAPVQRRRREIPSAAISAEVPVQPSRVAYCANLKSHS
ncbi:MAG: hypothetical protein HYX43_18520 [Burkholderiales bacterium]|nr:hypothetical protein [Burkholderiales bacterium]